MFRWNTPWTDVQILIVFKVTNLTFTADVFYYCAVTCRHAASTCMIFGFQYFYIIPFLINSIAQTRPEIPAPRMSTFLPFPSAVILGGAVMVDVIARSQPAMVAIIADVPATISMQVKKSRFVKIVLSVI